MKKIILSVSAFALPLMALAFNATEPTTGSADLTPVNTLVGSIGTIVNLLLPIVIAIALVFFFWGLAQYILAAGNEDAKADGRRKMIGGIIALFVMVAIWGIVTFIADSLGIGVGGNAPVPGVEGPGVEG